MSDVPKELREARDRLLNERLGPEHTQSECDDFSLAMAAALRWVRGPEPVFTQCYVCGARSPGWGPSAHNYPTCKEAQDEMSAAIAALEQEANQ